MVDRTLQQRTRERVVAHGHDPVYARCCHDSGEVAHLHRGVGGRFDPEHVGALAGGGDGLGLLHRNEAYDHPAGGLEITQPRTDPGIGVMGHDDDATWSHEVENR